MEIVMVGACYLDTILNVPHYPEEDTKLRASNLETRRGGNCANSLEVLQQLIVRHGDDKGARQISSRNRLHLVACLPKQDGRAAQQVMQSFGDDTIVSFKHCLYREEATEAASSYIIRSMETGSRTLVNYNALDEMTVAEFEAIARDFETEGKSWWHFEGRIPETTLECIRVLRRLLPGSKISVEVEKPGREGLRELAAEADVVFYSKVWAEESGYDSAMACLTTEPRGQASLSLCPWGAGGAYAVSHLSGDQIHCPVEQQPDEITVVDSVGAGDTFIAGMLHGFTTGSDEDAPWDARRCVRFAVDLATLKVQREGFAGLGDDILHSPPRGPVTRA
ncbi:Carbohydrate/purine kinase [Akanthomyces lecanii RCEF 1005]|uniref:Carbohydrate/purine kinase n=1 Tax=Akanthomyces lecanii RCEF 1005 TaxID=1081108 RepID=A0A168HB69_CORDF|nr:Carbohydrate/purine kinase [Akanthomyces lecanii RCEF 1005]